MSLEEAPAGRSTVVRVVTVLSMLVAAVLGGLALQAPAQAYPFTVCSVTISPSSLHVTSGQTYTLTGSSAVTTHWTVTINGVKHYYTGTSFTATYKAPTVTKRTVIGLSVTCTNSSGALTLRYRLVVDPFAIGSGGHLPNTGGPSIWWLIVGLMAAISGAFMTWANRRRPQMARVVAKSSGGGAHRR